MTLEARFGSAWARYQGKLGPVALAAFLGIGIAFHDVLWLVLVTAAVAFISVANGRARAMIVLLAACLAAGVPWILAPLLAGTAWVLWPDPATPRRTVVHELAENPGRRRGLSAVAIGLIAGVLGAGVLYLQPRPGFTVTTVAYPWAVLLPGILLLAAANGLGEELLWRGALFAAQKDMALRWLLLLQAASFGLAHLHGTPSGWPGVLVTASFACAAVTVRARWGFVCGVLLHTAADTVLFVQVMNLNGRHLF